MRRLSLYTEAELPGVNRAAAEAHNPTCDRCGPATPGPRRCLPAEGKADGALLLAGPATGVEQAQGRPWVSTVLRRVRAIVATVMSVERVAFDHAARCGLTAGDSDAAVSKCEPYLARVLEQSAPRRILAFGASAQVALLGRAINPRTVGRRPYAWTSTPRGMVPVFSLPAPGTVIGNRFTWQRFVDDVSWSLTCDVEEPEHFEADARIIEARDHDASTTTAMWAALRDGYAFDCETSGRWGDGDLELLDVACAPLSGGDVWVWPRALLRDRAQLGLLRMLFGRPDTPRVAFNVPFDVRVIQQTLGLRIPGRVDDVRVVRKLLDTDASGSLDDCAELVGMGGHKALIDDALAAAVTAIRAQVRALDAPASPQGALALGDGGRSRAVVLPERQARLVAAGVEPKKYAFALLNDDLRSRYCARDAYAAAALHRTLMPELRADSELWDVYRFEAGPAAHAVAEIESAGISVDRAAVESLSAYLAGKQNEEARMLRQYGAVNLNSPAQVSKLLFDTLGLKAPDNERSTSAETLERMRLQHPIVPRLLEWRRLERLCGQYADGMLPWIQADGRIYPGVLPEGARSGRMSHNEPNLGNLPRATQSEEARMVRAAFRASPGRWLVEIDYSQIELRIAALLSGEVAMIEAYRRGEDLHLLAAKAVARQEGIDGEAWDALPADERSRRRSDAKTAVFAHLYGRGIGALAEQIGRTRDQAEQFVRAIFGHYTQLSRYTKQRVAEARANGECRTWWAGRPARRRALLALGYPEQPDGRTPAAVGTEERAAYNTPIQGTAAAFLNASLWPTVEWIRECAPDVRLVLPVHDAMLFDVPDERVPEVIREVSAIMLAHDSGGVPLDVEAKVGRTWGDMWTFTPEKWTARGK